MTRPYRVEQENPPCGDCGAGGTWWVLDPNGTVLSTSWVDEDDAIHFADALNAAYELGLKTAVAVTWTKFSAETPPPRNALLITWDYELNHGSQMYTGGADAEADLAHAHLMKYSHWMLANAIRGPSKEELPAVIETLPPSASIVIPAPSNWDDDTPF